MPFTASLSSSGRSKSGLATCAGLLAVNLWDQLEWEPKRRTCESCLLRLVGKPSCSLDFLTLGNVSQLKLEIAKFLAWTAETSPGWPSLPWAFHEAGIAYRRIGWELPSPGGVIDDFMKQFAGVTRDESLWKDWNIYVEQYEGKPLKADVPPQMKAAIDEIVDAVTSPASLSGDKLLMLMAAAAVFSDAGISLELGTLQGVFGQLLEVAVTAVKSDISLEVS